MLSIRTKKDKREAVIRSSILEFLKDSVQSLIYGPGGENVPRLSSSIPNSRTQVLGHTDNTNALCCVLEAIFIHGLKDSLGEKLSSMLLGDLDRMPVPNFWLVVMVISHRDLIEQVSSLSFIMSDVGKARAWMRLAINQGQLLSYLAVLASDSQTLKEYYRSTAFLRDVESCDIMLRILQPLMGIAFNLATNAAVLNTWTQTPLVLSGVWIPAKYEQSIGPILSATDVVSTFTDEDSEELGVSIPYMPLSDQMFDLIIGGTPETNFISENPLDEDISCPKVEELTGARRKTKHHVIPASPKPVIKHQQESLDPKPQPSAKVENETPFAHEDEDDSSFRCRRLSSTTTLSERDSIMNRSISLVSDTNEYRNLLSDWESSENRDNLPAFLNVTMSPFTVMENMLSPTQIEVSPEEENDFEVLSPKLPSEEEMSSFLPLLTILMNEKGLDYQNYHCNTVKCSVPIGMIYGKPRLCKYDGKYYCYECHQGDSSVIPARVIHNWDFAQYPVCSADKKWLDTVFMHPVLDVRLVNPQLYQYVPELSKMQVLRIQLHFIQAYLFTCSLDKGHDLRKMFWPREHLYEHVHLYSVYDLKQVHDGKLVALATQAVTNGKQHVMKCQVCSPRGFICEVCKDSGIIYPFQLTKTFTCPSCCGVFHKTCVKVQADCPRCRRIAERKENTQREEEE